MVWHPTWHSGWRVVQIPPPQMLTWSSSARHDSTLDVDVVVNLSLAWVSWVSPLFALAFSLSPPKGIFLMRSTGRREDPKRWSLRVPASPWTRVIA
ncbi:hypothetical protein BHM03_00046373 [Ensete ventricosum]|nr:hypothetical protein BHM03_00046373 [Ensete ventricosum]